MQRHVAEPVAQRRRPAAPARLAVGRADRERDRGPQHRRVRRALQDRLVLAREHAVLLGQQARPARRPRPARGRRARRRGSAAAPAPSASRLPTQRACRTASTGKPASSAGANSSSAGAGELGLLGQRADAEQRLVGGALLGLDHQRGRLARVLAHRRVGAAPEIVLERLVGDAAVGRDDDERVGLPVRRQARARRRRGSPRGAAATPARASSRARRRPRRRAGRRRAARRRPAPPARRRRSAGRRRRRRAPRPGGARGRRSAGRPGRPGLGERDGDVDLGHVGGELAQPRRVPRQVAAQGSGSAWRVVGERRRARRGSARPGRRAGRARARSRRRRGGRSAPGAAAAPTSRRPAGTGRRRVPAR